jgi:uncharacterized 2Fe-2S/4Fe-4S cluster protein (DUF4445 family)
LSSSEQYGIAIDLGTTTIAAVLVTLADGCIVASCGGLNPQRQYGLDVIARLDYACRSQENLRHLQRLVNGELAHLAAQLLAQAGATAASVALVAIAGNPTMSQLLLGLPVDTLARPPYRPQSTAAHFLATADLGWRLNLPLYVFPSPGGFVGGDTVAFLYGLGLAKSEIRSASDPGGAEPALFLDLGTNGEIALLAEGTLYATSAAAGPAFEGGNLTCGMAALPGAITTVTAANGRLALHTLGDRPPAGLCGSGVLDTIALLLREGLLETTGGLLDPAQVASPLGDRLQEIGEERHFVIYRDAVRRITLSQTDIRQVQLAKGAVRAGMEVLFARAGIAGDAVAEVVITGSFGASLSLESLKSIGVLSENMVKNARFVREGALSGVVRRLSLPAAAAAVEALAGELRIVPLSGTPLFEQHFIEQINFPPTI